MTLKSSGAALITQHWSRVLINTSEKKTAVNVHLILCLCPLCWLRDPEENRQSGSTKTDEMRQCSNMYRLFSQPLVVLKRYFCVTTVRVVRNMMTNLQLFWTKCCVWRAAVCYSKYYIRNWFFISIA